MQLPWYSFHFVGIGGIGMSGLAHILLDLGYKVSGSDIKDTPLLKSLCEKGAKIYIGHKAEHINDAEVIVYSSAIKSNNIELLTAKKKKIPLISRGKMLSLFMSQKKGIAIAGTHGKTTTAAMAATMLKNAAFSPTTIVGGIINGTGLNAWLGDGEYLVAEADESDKSFLLLDTEIAIITNIDADHLDHYSNITEIETTFLKFLKKVKNTAIICGEDKRLKNLAKELDVKVYTYGFSKTNDFEARDLRLKDESYFDFYFKGENI
ncbi:MAG TPA: UDP-N-acetylmuramate--L-alanine ligase, partial [Candidatus Desulfofervidus auxilii]|nr:UDP-N-acetylmuramate--L-alanine ligase [Candidatus Desulfofervidus auxilii]